MPELPDIALYLEHLAPRVLNQTLQRVVVRNPFVLRSFDPPISDAAGKRVLGLRRMGKRIVFALEGRPVPGHPPHDCRSAQVVSAGQEGRRQARAGGVRVPGGAPVSHRGRHQAAGLDPPGFGREGIAAVRARRAGGAGVGSRQALPQRLRSENHTLKRALTDPRLFSGIGNAYSDEILHRARLSPLALTRKLSRRRCRPAVPGHSRDARGLDRASPGRGWGGRFPEKVTAFREGMAVHGRYQLPCPDCGTPVQRIRYADNETNYCARCQTGGRLLADRAMSRLLKEDWPRSIDEVE